MKVCVRRQGGLEEGRVSQVGKLGMKECGEEKRDEERRRKVEAEAFAGLTSTER